MSSIFDQLAYWIKARVGEDARWNEETLKYGAHHGDLAIYKNDRDGIDIVYTPTPFTIAEYTSDGRLFIFNRKQWCTTFTNRLSYLVPDLTFGTNVLKKANGLQLRRFHIFSRVTNPEFKNVLAHDRFEVTYGEHSGYALHEADERMPTIKKDHKKYRAFNKELTKLCTVLKTQIRVGAYDAFLLPREYHFYRNFLLGEDSKELRNALDLDITFDNKHTFIHRLKSDQNKERISNAMIDYLQTLDVSLLNKIMGHITIAFDSSGRDDRKSLLRKLKYAYTNTQQQYLRQHCIIIGDSQEQLSLDYDKTN